MLNVLMTHALYKNNETVLILDVISKEIEVGGLKRQVLDVMCIRESGEILIDRSNLFKVKTDKPSGAALLQAFHNNKDVMIMNIIPVDGRMDVIYFREDGVIAIDNAIRFKIKIKKPSKIIKV